MIQEVFGGTASSLLGDPKFSFHGSPSPSPSEKAPHESPATKSSTATCESNINKLRCPRCDSANTKFCYYNNYNLTQPRHFCKTCRRYWTKGGALRNVPIGGGCRKNKTTIITTSSSNNKSTMSSKLLNTVSSSPTRPGFHQLELPSYNSNTSHLLALLRSTSQNPNPSHNPISSHLAKQENMVGGHMMMPNTNHPLPSVLDHLGDHQAPSLGLSWTTPQNGTFLGNNIAQNTRMQQLYQRLMIRSSTTTTTTTNNYFSDHYNSQPVVLMSNAGSSSASSILDSAPVTGESGYGWNHVNPAFSWSDDLPTTNGAYP